MTDAALSRLASGEHIWLRASYASPLRYFCRTIDAFAAFIGKDLMHDKS